MIIMKIIVIKQSKYKEITASLHKMTTNLEGYSGRVNGFMKD